MKGISVLVLYFSVLYGLLAPIFSVASVIPAAAGHVTGRLSRKRRAHRNGKTIAEMDATSRTHPTILLYLYAYLVTFLTVFLASMVMTFVWIAFTYSSEALTENYDLPALDVNSGLAGNLFFGFAISCMIVSAFSTGYWFASQRIPKRRRDKATQQTPSHQ
jgi:hypothetical protein